MALVSRPTMTPENIRSATRQRVGETTTLIHLQKKRSPLVSGCCRMGAIQLIPTIKPYSGVGASFIVEADVKLYTLASFSPTGYV